MTKYSFCPFFWIVIFLLSACQVNSPSFQENLNASISNSEAFDQSFTGCIIYDPKADKTIFSYNADKFFNAASNTKLFTFYAGLTILEDSIPAFKYTVHDDSLIIKGTGDPSFLNPDLQTNGRVLKFLSDPSKNIFLISAPYPKQRYGPGWAWDDYNDFYATEKAAFPIYGNTIRVLYSAEKPLPEVFPGFFSKFFTAENNGSNDTGNNAVQRSEHSNDFTYRILKDTLPATRVVPFVHTEELLVALMADTLNKNVGLLQEYSTQHLNNDLYGIHADSLYRRMLHVSDNFIAEQLLLLCSQKLSDTLDSKIAIKYMEDHYLTDLSAGMQWADGSGLSRYNLFTPRAIVMLLKKINDLVADNRLFKLMPAGDQSKNLQEKYNKVQPFIYAKSGTLSNNYNLSGYIVAKSGRKLIFSFMNNNFTTDDEDIKREMENVLAMFYENY